MEQEFHEQWNKSEKELEDWRKNISKEESEDAEKQLSFVSDIEEMTSQVFYRKGRKFYEFEFIWWWNN